MKDNNGNIILCDYGCNQEAVYILKNGKHCCSDIFTKCPQIKKKNSKGVKKAYEDGKIDQSQIYKNKSEESKKRMNWNKGKTSLTPEICKDRKYVSAEDIIKMINNHIIDIEYKCSKCGNTGTWLNDKLILEVHHIDGNHFNNDISNLCLLCPNCHSQTDNYRNKLNKTKHKKHIFIEKELLNHIHEYDYDIEKFINSYYFNNKSKVYSKFFELVKNGKIIIPVQNQVL